MAPSRSATSFTWSAGTNRNSASLSTNFLMSQGQATRSTLTCSRVIHFIIASPLSDTDFGSQLTVECVINDSTPLHCNKIIRAGQSNAATDQIQSWCTRLDSNFLHNIGLIHNSGNPLEDG